MPARTILILVALLACASPLKAQEKEPRAQSLQVEVSERTELRWKGGAKVDETRWRLRALEVCLPEKTTRHVVIAEKLWIRGGVEKSKSNSIAEGRRVLLVKNEFGAWTSTWTNDAKADLKAHSLVGCRIDPGRWIESLKGERGAIPISRELPPLIEYHVDRLQDLSRGEGTWRIERDAKRGEVRFLAEWKPVQKGQARELVRSLRIVVKTEPSKKPLPAKPKAPPVPCAPCDGSGEAEGAKCRGAAKPCATHGSLRYVECPACEGRGLR